MLASSLLAGGLMVWLAYDGISSQGTVASPIAGLGQTSPERSKPLAEGAAPLTQADVTRFCTSLLKEAERTLASTRSIQTVFHKQERVGGQLQETNVMHMKVRREPFSVYMRWHSPDEGREVIWQEDANDGLLLVHPGGWRRKLVPLMKVDPNGQRALESSRRPISSAGIWKFNERLLEFVQDAKISTPGVKAEMDESAKIGNRECYCFRFIHDDRSAKLDFQKVLIYIDKRLGLPIALVHYGWPAEDAHGEPVLEEAYVFNDLVLNPPLADLDFSTANPNYEYGKK
jgi:hypothetical protein